MIRVLIRGLMLLIKGGVLIDRKQLEQLMRITFRGVRANLPAQREKRSDRGKRSCFCSCYQSLEDV